jgi:hypothetical protein
MSATVTSLVVASGVFLAGFCALVFFPKLPTHHRTNETRDVVRLGIGIVSLLTSLVLGLLIASAKSTFDTTDGQMRAYAADFIVLDQVLRNYGPEADGVRSVLRVYVDRVIRSIWPGETTGEAVRLEEDMTGGMLDRVMQSVLALKATNPDQVWLRQQALGTVSRLIQTRWSLLVNQNGTISPVILEVVVTWIMVIFASFGLNAPYNGTVVGAFLICALSIGASVFLIQELDAPLNGVIVISAEPMKNAQAHLGQ